MAETCGGADGKVCQNSDEVHNGLGRQRRRKYLTETKIHEQGSAGTFEQAQAFAV